MTRAHHQGTRLTAPLSGHDTYSRYILRLAILGLLGAGAGTGLTVGRTRADDSSNGSELGPRNAF